jgi:hypothetical protein
MLRLQRGGQAQQLALGQLRIGAVPGLAHGTAHAGVQRLGQVIDHVAPLVVLMPMSA